MSAELPLVLREAHAIVAEQLSKLRSLADSARQGNEALSSTLRLAERQLDEATIQYHTALERHLPNVASLAQREADLRAQCDTLERELRTNRHALKQLEQLVRQIEMSTDALTSAADPWVQALRAQVIHGREEERTRLAREVHDGPAQVLANSLMILESCYTLAQQTTSEKLVTMLDRLREATREGLLEVRRFIADLRPGGIEEHGLVAAVKEHLRTYANKYDMRVHLEAGSIPALPTEVAIVLYRIIQEALQNARKYARGASVVVRLVPQGQQLLLSVRDDGPGFDPHEVARRAGRSNWGLTSMRERAELIGAQLTVASRLGHGTEVTLVLPLE